MAAILPFFIDRARLLKAPWAASGLKSQRRPLAAELGSNLRTILRTYVDFQEKNGSQQIAENRWYDF